MNEDLWQALECAAWFAIGFIVIQIVQAYFG